MKIEFNKNYYDGWFIDGWISIGIEFIYQSGWENCHGQLHDIIRFNLLFWRLEIFFKIYKENDNKNK